MPKANKSFREVALIGQMMDGMGDNVGCLDIAARLAVLKCKKYRTRPFYSHRFRVEYRQGRLAAAPDLDKEVMPMSDEKKYTFRCTVCGYEVTVDTPELPEDYVCPVCGVGPEMFELVED